MEPFSTEAKKYFFHIYSFSMGGGNIFGGGIGNRKKD
jgi:hypothetical protein